MTLNKELFDTITELRQEGMKWQEIFNKVSSHYFASTHIMKKNFERYRQRYES